jgi:hypothetical protein
MAAQTTACPFVGGHWQAQRSAGGQKMMGKHFCQLQEEQKMDLMAYFYAHDSQKTSPSSQPPYPFALKKLGHPFNTSC